MISLAYDVELERLLNAAARVSQPGVPAAGDAEGLRAYIDAGCRTLLSRIPDCPTVSRQVFCVTRAVGEPLTLHWFQRRDGAVGSAVVYVHGGGMIAGSVGIYAPLIRRYVEMTGVPFLAVGYGLAPERRAGGLSADVFDALLWLIERSAQLGVDRSRIALMGDSGGGGLAAAAAIRARDANVSIARQILIYPMLDDRTVTPDPRLAEFALWTYEQNATAWSAVHGGSAQRSPYVAPARLQDYSGLAPAFIEVGELDIFRDECVEYAARLHASGASCELQVKSGIAHGAEWLDFEAGFSRRIMAERARVITSI